MDLKDYTRILWRRKWIVVVTTVAALVITIIGTAMIKPAYQATTTLRLAVSASGPLSSGTATYATHLVNTAAEIAASKPMLDKAVQSLGLKEKPLVTAIAVPDTELIRITVEASSAKVAAQVANALAEMLIAESNQVYTGGQVKSQDILAQQLATYKAELDQTRQEYDALVARTPPAPEHIALTLDLLQLKERNYEAMLLQYNDAILQQQVQSSMMTVVEAAAPPPSPIRPQATYNYGVGLAVGLLMGVLLAFAANGFDSTLYGGKDVEQAAGLPILATIPRVRKSRARFDANERSPLAEAFRNLALTVITPGREQAGKVVLVLSAESQQGKSTVAANLATALAEYGKNTVVVDCDMRRPKLHEFFNLPNASGLHDILEGQSDLSAELKHATEHIAIITSGAQPLNPSQLLGSANMTKLITDLRKQFDVILLDTPALVAVSDATTVAQNAKLAASGDISLLVVSEGHSQREPVQTAGKLIEKLPHQLAGVVLNQAGLAVSSYYYRGHKAPAAA